MKCMKTYEADRPVNAAIISPIMDHVVVGGGQDAMSVTTTSSKAGKFDSKIFYKAGPRPPAASLGITRRRCVCHAP